MLTFQAIGDGNCLYNSQAVLLIQAFRQKELDILFKNKQLLNQFHQLLKIYQGNELIGVADKPTPKAVKDGFNRLIEKFTVDGKINWDELQEEMAVGLREFVQNAIITDDATNQLVRKELVRALDFSIDMGYHNGVLSENLEENGIDGSYFEEMDTIKNKILQILNDDEFLTQPLKKIALSEWFFDGEAVGFNDYLQGEKGIGNRNIHAADIEIKVLSSKLGIVNKTYMRGQIGNEQSATYYNAFASNDDSRNLASSVVVFTLEKSPNHWNPLLIDTPSNQTLFTDNQARLKDNELQVYLATYGSYEAHREWLEISEEAYCQLYDLTKEQLNEPVVVKADDKVLPIKQKPASNAKVNEGISRSFAINWASSGAVLATFTHCFVMPVLKAALFGAAMASQASLMLLLTVAVSVVGGYLVANKMEKVPRGGAAEAAASNVAMDAATKTQSSHNDKTTIDLLVKSPTLLVYQNTQAQQAKRTENAILQGRPSGPRQKLH